MSGQGRLSHKRVIITGAASGIGEASARLYAAEGASLVLADIDPKGASVARELDAEFVRCDVSSAADVERLAAKALERLGGADVLFANAGIAVESSVLATTEDDWQRVLGTDLTGVWLTCRAFLPSMLAIGGGSIIATASQLGLVGIANLAAYTAAKGGVINLMRSLAAEHGRDGIRANALCPGPTWTPLTERLTHRDGANEDALHTVAERTLLGRFGRPEELASAALFLASDESSYVTGSALVVDGGYTAV
jgi:meso-butanediol dehydrogenase/(S,S)-butanediol dehydrogenase/diacetyl reductase